MKLLLLLFIIFISSINVKSQTLIPSPEQVKVLEGYVNLTTLLFLFIYKMITWCQYPYFAMSF